MLRFHKAVHGNTDAACGNINYLLRYDNRSYETQFHWDLPRQTRCLIRNLRVRRNSSYSSPVSMIQIIKHYFIYDDLDNIIVLYQWFRPYSSTLSMIQTIQTTLSMIQTILQYFIYDSDHIVVLYLLFRPYFGTLSMIQTIQQYFIYDSDHIVVLYL